MRDEDKNALLEGWNDPLRMIELYKENVLLTLEKEESQRSMDDPTQKAVIVLGTKEMLRRGPIRKPEGTFLWRTKNSMTNYIWHLERARMPHFLRVQLMCFTTSCCQSTSPYLPSIKRPSC